MITARPKADQPAPKTASAVSLAVASAIVGIEAWKVAKIYTPITSTTTVTINATTRPIEPRLLSLNDLTRDTFKKTLWN